MPASSGPLFTTGFNETLGWTHTVNLPDLDDIYVLELDKEKPHHYLHDGKSMPLASREISVPVRGAQPQTRTHWSSHLGPIVHRTQTRRRWHRRSRGGPRLHLPPRLDDVSSHRRSPATPQPFRRLRAKLQRSPLVDFPPRSPAYPDLSPDAGVRRKINASSRGAVLFHRHRIAGQEIAANGAPGEYGVFRVMGYHDDKDGKRVATGAAVG